MSWTTGGIFCLYSQSKKLWMRLWFVGNPLFKLTQLRGEWKESSGAVGIYGVGIQITCLCSLLVIPRSTRKWNTVFIEWWAAAESCKPCHCSDFMIGSFCYIISYSIAHSQSLSEPTVAWQIIICCKWQCCAPECLVSALCLLLSCAWGFTTVLFYTSISSTIGSAGSYGPSCRDVHTAKLFLALDPLQISSFLNHPINGLEQDFKCDVWYRQILKMLFRRSFFLEVGGAKCNSLPFTSEKMS